MLPQTDGPSNPARAAETVDSDSFGFGGLGVAGSGAGTVSGTELVVDIVLDHWILKIRTMFVAYTVFTLLEISGF